YLRLEVLPRVQVHVRVRDPSEAVVAHRAVRDEVPRPGCDVIHPKSKTEVLDGYDSHRRAVLDGLALQAPLAADRGVDGLEELHRSPASSEDPDGVGFLGRTPILHSNRESE